MAAPTATGSSTGSAESQKAPEEAVTILVVEDDEFMRHTMQVMLETIARDSADIFSRLGLPSLQLHVQYTSSGEGGWDLLRAQKIDIALIDIHLPGVSGLDLSWCVRVPAVGTLSCPVTTHNSHCHLAVDRSSRCYQQMHGSTQNDPQASSLPSHQTILIACTSDAGTTRDRLADYGLHDVLPKPVSISQLRHMLHKWLPRQTIALPAAASGSTPSVGRVLLVDDCAITLSATTLVLQQLGVYADAVTDGASAMLLCNKHDYDLLLFDVNLPDLSGYALCSWYKEMCRTHSRPVGYVVAVTAEPDAESCRAFEIDQCLAKPLSTSCVAKALQDFWRQQEQQALQRAPADLRAISERAPREQQALQQALAQPAAAAGATPEPDAGTLGT